MTEEQGKYFLKNYALDHMTTYSNYPQSLLKAMQVRTLIGPPDGDRSVFGLSRVMDPT